MEKFRNFVKGIYNIHKYYFEDVDFIEYDDEARAIEYIYNIFNARHKSVKLNYLLICQKWHEMETGDNDDACWWYKQAAEAVVAYAKEMAA